MSTLRDPTEYLRGLAAQQAESLLAAKPGCLAPARLRAVQRLQDAALPEREHEGWRYTSLNPFLEHRFTPCEEDFTALQPADIEDFLLHGQAQCHRLVLVNGRFSAPLSALADLPVGSTVTGLRSALQRQEEPGLQRLDDTCGDEEHFFNTLNAAFMGDGAFVRIGRGLRLEHPIELLHVAIGRDEPPMTHPRHLILLEEGAEARVIERFLSLGPSVYFNNLVSEIHLDPSAHLDHDRVQQESGEALHLASLRIRQGASSRYRGTTIALGAAWSRTEVKVDFAGPDGEAVLNGLYMAGDRQVTDMHLDVRHEVPGCRSREHFKGILDGRGIAVFDGRVLVQKDAQQTNAHLNNANLILSGNAEIDTKPQLEIYADDVQCSHGTTVGQLDPDMLFYMRSRGIGEGEARKLICLGFAGEILDTLNDLTLREQAATALQLRLAQSQKTAL